MCVVANYAVEDVLSETVMRRCFNHTNIESGASLGREGFGYLKRIAPALNNSAAGVPYVMLTDLDQVGCPPDLLADWMGTIPIHPDFLLRVAVKEVEAWILADRKGLARYLGVPQANFPRVFEQLPDPKHELLMVARRSRHRRIREDIVAETAHGPVQGPDYNGSLSRFVTDQWDIDEAAVQCPSLRKMLGRLEELRERKLA